MPYSQIKYKERTKEDMQTDTDAPQVFDNQLVHLIDDDEAVLDALGMLLDSVTIQYKAYSNAVTFFDCYTDQELTTLSGCLVLDIRMPGMSGMECQQRLKALHCNLPIIFLTGHGDVPIAVEAMKQGAVEFIQKPFREQALLDKIQNALTSNQLTQSDILHRLTIQKRRASLTKREQHVLQQVVAGHANKIIAFDLNLSQRTVEIHRANVMEKMQANSLAELVAMVLSSE